ncbi:Cyclin-L2, partial [Armadillidium vulgare]
MIQEPNFFEIYVTAYKAVFFWKSTKLLMYLLGISKVSLVLGIDPYSLCQEFSVNDSFAFQNTERMICFADGAVLSLKETVDDVISFTLFFTEEPQKPLSHRIRKVEGKVVLVMENFVNDSLRTDVCVRYSPETIACSCIWLAGRRLKIPLPENPPWYHVFGVNLSDIEKIAASIMKLYTRKKTKLKVLETKV